MKPTAFSRLVRTGSPAACLLAAAIATPCVQAASDSWNVDAAGNWAAFGSWLSGTQAPGATSGTTNSDIATFGVTLATADRIVTVDANRNIGGITFSHTSGWKYTLSGGNLLLTNAGAVQETSASGTHTDTISTAIAIQGDGGTAAFTASGAASLLSIGAVTGVSTSPNTTTLTLNGASTGANAITGVIGNGSAGGKLAIIKDGAGSWTLSGANTFSGGVTLSLGKLTLGSTTALGAAGGSFAIAGATTLDCSAGNNTIANNNPVTINGDFTFAGSQNLNLGTGAISLGTAAGTGRTITTTANTLTLGGIIADGSTATALTKSGNGALTLAGANTFSGGVTLTTGTLNINNATALGATGGAFTISGGTIDNTSAATISNSNNNAQNWNGNFTFTGTKSLNLGTGAVTLGGNRQVTVSANTLTAGGDISGGTYTLTKAGAGTLALAGNNNYTGVTTITGGSLQLNSANALPGGIATAGGTSALTFNGGVLGLGNGDFTRNLGSAGTATAANFTGAGGWAAYSADRVVNLNNDSHQIVWATANTGFNGKTLILGAATSTNTVDLQNPIDFGTATRTIQVDDGTAAVDGKLSGNLTSGAGSGLIKTGAGTLVLTGSNSYSGTTTISAGALQASEGTSLPTGSFLSLDGGVLQSSGVTSFTRSLATSGATGFQFTANGGGFAANGGQLTVNIGGASAELVWGTTVGTNVVGTLQFGSAAANNKTLFQNGIDLNAVTRTINVTAGTGGDSVEIAGVIRTSSGTAGLTKTGTGTLTLTGSNTYNGATTISGGTLALSGGANRLLNTGTLTFNGNNTILDLGATSQTLASLTVSQLAQTNTIQGGGSLILNGANDFRLGPTASPLTQALNLAAVTNFTYNAPSNSFDVGPQTGSTTGTYTTTLTLATNNTITAVQFGVGDISPNSGTSNNPSTVNLGQTNAINADTIKVGVGGRNGGNLLFTAGLTSPSLTIRATNGSGRANWTVGSIASNRADSQLNTDTVDLVTGVTGTSSLDAQVGTLTLGYGTRTSSQMADVTGIFTMGGGTLDATTIILGQDTSGGSSGTCTGTLSLNGGTVKVTTLTIGNKLGNNIIAGNFNLNSGTLRATTVQPGTGTATRNLNWTAGSIQNYDASTDLTIASGVTLSLIAGSDHTFNIDANRTASVASVISNSGNLVKSGTGTLVLSTTNTYTGATTVKAGILNVTGSLASGSAVTVGGTGSTGTPTLAGTGTINGATTIATAGSGVVGIHAPGVPGVNSGVGTQTFSSSLTYQSGSIFAWELNANLDGDTADAGDTGTRGSNYDAVTVTGALDVQAGAIFRVVKGAGLGFADNFWTTNQQWKDIFSAGSITNGWAANTAVAAYTYDAATNVYTPYTIPVSGSFSVTGTTLSWTAVPEPTSALAGLLLGAGLLRRRRGVR